jgi:hypothetical protein
MYLIKVDPEENNRSFFLDSLGGELIETTKSSNAAAFLFAHEALKKINELREQFPDRSFLLEETF